MDRESHSLEEAEHRVLVSSIVVELLKFSLWRMDNPRLSSIETAQRAARDIIRLVQDRGIRN